MMRIIAIVVSLLLLGGCSDWTYQRTNTGKLKGTVLVKWLSQDRFVFLPDTNEPLTFTRAGDEVITPAEMFTDGGTIPPALRVLKAYSPWGYAPAFIIHDWLFVMHHCKLPGHEKFDLEKAAIVMAEVMKTMMEDPRFGGPNKLVLHTMYEGVRSAQAKEFWNNGSCELPDGTMRAGSQARTARALRELRADSSLPTFVIKF